MLRNWLINRAKRTPYFHLPGYMNRWWLVPYNVVIERTIPAWDGTTLKAGTICNALPYTVTDGTGPVTWRRPIARLLQKLGIAVRVHEILRSDEGRDPHDHPWPYVTVILKGGYFETRYNDKGEFVSRKWHGPGSILYRPAGSWHRLDLPNGMVTTTLFITGPKVQSWGFNVGGVKVPYYEYLEKKGDA